MQKLLAFVVAAALVVPTLASAATPGVNLGWNNCGTTSTTENRVFTCDDNNLTFNLVGSFRVADPIAEYVGLSAFVDFRVNDASLPAWWSMGTGGCREGSLALVNVGTLGGCTNPYSGAGGQGGGFVIEDIATLPGTNDLRVRLDWARDSPFSMAANTLYSGFVLQINSSNSFDEGFGVCAGCATAACAVLNYMEVFPLTGASVVVEAADVRNWATYQGGAVGTDVCPNGTPTQSRTWGQIKALYR